MMQNINVFRKTWALAVVLVIIFNYQPLKAQDSIYWGNDKPFEFGTVFDYSGTDGCGFVIFTDDDNVYEIIDITSDIRLQDSMRIAFTYTKLDLITTCMMGQPIRVEWVEIIAPDCMADFQYEKIRCEIWDSQGRCGPRSYAFYNKSDGEVAGFYWDFGDGNQSDEADPMHIYKEDGIFEVVLKILTADGCTSTKVRKVNVGGVTDPCDARISYDRLGEDSIIYDHEPAFNDIYFPDYTYFFHDISLGDVIGRTWTFSDGAVYQEKNPVHVFEGPGTYEVCLQIYTAEDCSDEVCLSIVVGDTSQCQAMFEYYPLDYIMDAEDSLGIWPLPGYFYQLIDVSFTDVKSRIWFIDGDTIHDDPHPVYGFEKPGAYTVTLIIETTDGCTSEYSQVIHVDIPQQCHAYFEYYPFEYWGEFIDSIVLDDSVPVFVDSVPRFDLAWNNGVHFVDLSNGDIVDWYWDFGDGNTSSEQSPVHNYEIPGTYHVCLIIATAEGCEDQFCMEVKVGHVQNCSAYFEYCEYKVNSDRPFRDTLWFESFWPDTTGNDGPWYIGFKNMSTGNIMEMMWDFGDGYYSYDKNPVHMYYNPGYYDVWLSIRTYDGCEEVYRTTIKVGDVNCEVDFTYDIIYPDCGGYSPAYLFKPVTDQLAWNYYWDFGDGEFSYDPQPLHIFDSYQSYEVCLEVYTENNCIIRKCHTVWVNLDETDSAFIEKCGTTALRNLRSSNTISVTKTFPNPASDVVNIILESDQSQTVSISMINVLGQRFEFESSYLLMQGENEISLQTDGLQSGNYYYIIAGNEHIVRGTITIVD